MKPERSLYDNPRIAAGYAYARPPVHARILDRIRGSLPFDGPVSRALDIGCGAGRSTAVLGSLAATVVGVDPASSMLEHRRSVAPTARFVIGLAEELPFADRTFNLITAAGSINYAEASMALSEIARVLSPDGMFLIYDFSAGRRFESGDGLDVWYSQFERRYQDAPGYEMDVTRLPFGAVGLSLDGYDEFDISIPMTLDSYLRYVLSETRVELARAAGLAASEIERWCRQTLRSVFDHEPLEVMFRAYVACVRWEIIPA